MDEKNTTSITKQITTKKGEVLTITVNLVNTSPHKQSVRDFLFNMFKDLLSEFGS